MNLDLVAAAAMQQGTDEWLAVRLGKATASRIADVVAKTRSGWGASRTNYAAELIAERLTGKPAPRYVNAAMQWGTDTESMLCDAYAFRYDVQLLPCGFFDHPRIPMSGASPDRLIGDDGLLEGKCPNTATHIDTLLGADIDNKYLLQMQWQLACTKRKWVDFVSFDPRLPESMRLHVRRVDRDDVLIASLERDVSTFLDEVAARVDELRQRYEEAA